MTADPGSVGIGAVEPGGSDLGVLVGEGGDELVAVDRERGLRMPLLHGTVLVDGAVVAVAVPVGCTRVWARLYRPSR